MADLGGGGSVRDDDSLQWDDDALSRYFYDFLAQFGMDEFPPEDADTADAQMPESTYLKQLRTMKTADRATMHVSIEDVGNYHAGLRGKITARYGRVEPVLRKALHAFISDNEPGMVAGEMEQKEYYVAFHHTQSDKLRDLKTGKLGQLVSFSGTVTRSSEVRPELQYGAFKCMDCSTVIKGVEQQFKYTTPLVCSNGACGNKHAWALVREESVFCDWQRLKVQESTEEVPAGSLPRTMDVIMRNEAVETAKAGDKMVFTGTLVVVPDVSVISTPGQKTMSDGGRRDGGGEGVSGFKSVGARELTYKVMFIACCAQPSDVSKGVINIRSDEELVPELVMAEYDEESQAKVYAMMADRSIYSKLTKSLAPSVFGHDSIKQAVLLMLFGGVHKKTPEGINLRGDINVAIVGDPGCAKSQILKYVSNFLPRAVYTSGKASSAAGLTASVVKEPENNEFAIEAGALMLADNGICCIDEFDKMDVKDQVAIHEAMEQQTISISKAGIQATLNARASILAAANPMGGRYDKAKPLKYNVALPPAILSRFDLLHVMIDDTTEATDQRIATHILNVHRFQANAFTEATVPYNTDTIQHYIRYARSIKPQITDEAYTELVRAYKELRCDDAAPGSQTSYRITVRQLEALVRLSEAMARVHCEADIKPVHVREAKRLLKASILKIEQSDVELDDPLDADRPHMHPEGMHEDMDAEGMQQEDEHADAENNPAAANVNGVPVGAKRGLSSPGARDPKRMRADSGAPAPSPLAGGGASTSAGAGEPGAAEAPQPEQAPPAPAKVATKISAQKFNAVKRLLTLKLEEVREGGLAALATVQAGQETEGPQAAEDGIRQSELVSWYLKRQTDSGALRSESELEAEYDLVHKVINHLVKKQDTISTWHKPDREPTEDQAAYNARVQQERILSLHSNYAPEDAE